jgi:hypothetical protein
VTEAQESEKFQPPWSQTGKDAGSRDAILYRTEKGESAGQRVIGTTDEGVEVSVPHQPYVNMLDPSGHVCPVVTSTNRDLMQADQKYRHVTLTVRLRKGWLLWDYAQLAHGAGGMTREQWHERREVLREERRTKAKKGSARFDKMTNDKMADLLAACADNQKLLAGVLAKLEKGDLAGAEKLAAKGGAPKKDGSGNQ